MNYRTIRMTGLAILAMAAGAIPIQAETQGERLARLEELVAGLQEELAQVKKAPAPAASPLDTIKIGGDFRYRHEWTDDETKTADRNRDRIQARISLVGEVNDSIDYGVRLASGNSEEQTREGSPTSNNQDLGDAFSSKNIWLDLAYVEYKPQAVEGLCLSGGKINNPYTRVGNSDLMFDSDVTPEGLAVAYKGSATESLALFGAAGGFYVRERKEEAETTLAGVQGGGTLKLGEKDAFQMTAGAGYYDYASVQGREGLGADPEQFYGNRAVEGVYASDFELVQGFAEAGLAVLGQPVRVFGDYITNTQAESDDDTAFLVGASVGKLKDPGSWSLAYNYRDLEADSLLGVLAEATFGGGGTDVKGHKVSLSVQVAKNTQVGATYMMADRTRSGATADFDVGMVDFTFKF